MTPRTLWTALGHVLLALAAGVFLYLFVVIWLLLPGAGPLGIVP